MARIASCIFLAAVALAPLPLGSTSPAAPAIWSVVLGLSLLGSLSIRLRASQVGIIAAAVAVAAACLFVLHEQSAVSPWLSVPPDAVSQQALALLGQSGRPTAFARGQPFYAIGLGIVGFLAFCTAVVLASQRMQGRRLLWTVAISGAIYAVLAIFTHAIDPAKVFLIYEKGAHQASLTSPFLNRNTAAVYYGCCALIWLSLLGEYLQRTLRGQPVTWVRLRARLRRSGRDMAPIALGWIVCIVAMFLTGSRAGAAVSLAAMVLSLAALFHRRVSRWYGAAAILLGGGAFSLLLLQLLGGSVGVRFSAHGLSDEGRISTYRATLRMIEDHPWLGGGFGSFEMMFPAYRTDDISLAGVWNRAHNSLLELAAAGGVPLAAIVVLAALAAIGTLVYGIASRRRDVIFSVVGLCAFLIAAIHSMVDFSLQIPGYTIVIAGLLGAGLAQSFSSRGQH